MKIRLFFTGEMGVGKSTAIAAALEEARITPGGFFTRRITDDRGHPLSFLLTTPGGCREAVFLDLSRREPVLSLEVFDTLGVSTLKGPVLVLDEIGGTELLSPVFSAALEAVLQGDTPILGVLKGPGPANAMIRALGLSEEYRRRAEALWQQLSRDPDTCIYTCEKYDEKALALARQWVREYCL